MAFERSLASFAMPPMAEKEEAGRLRTAIYFDFCPLLGGQKRSPCITQMCNRKAKSKKSLQRESYGFNGSLRRTPLPPSPRGLFCLFLPSEWGQPLSLKALFLSIQGLSCLSSSIFKRVTFQISIHYAFN